MVALGITGEEVMEVLAEKKSRRFNEKPQCFKLSKYCQGLKGLTTTERDSANYNKQTPWPLRVARAWAQIGRKNSG